MAAFDALAHEAGVLQVGSLDEMVELSECFVHGRRPAGPRIAAVTGSGGKRAIFLDAAEALGLDVPPLPDPLFETMSGLLGPGCAVGNPLDAGFAAMSDPEAMPKLVDLLYEDPSFDLFLSDGDLPQHEGDRGASLAASSDRVARTGKPIIYYSPASYPMSDYARQVRRAGPNVAVLQGVPAALRALKSFLDYWAFPAPGPDPVSTSSAEAVAALERALSDSTTSSLSEAASLDLLGAYGLSTARCRMAKDEAAAANIAAELGFPVVAKVVSDAIQHKSDIGGVILDVRSVDDVRAAYRTVIESASKVVDRSAIGGVLIAEQVSGQLELLIGGLYDPEIGPLVMFGTGGVDVELAGDTAMALAPLDETRARTLIGRTRIASRLPGYRGRPPVDDAALVQAIIAVGNVMADAKGRIASIDVNPFLVSELRGVAVDALVMLAR
jgi:acetyltransferase